MRFQRFDRRGFLTRDVPGNSRAPGCVAALPVMSVLGWFVVAKCEYLWGKSDIGGLGAVGVLACWGVLGVVLGLRHSFMPLDLSLS